MDKAKCRPIERHNSPRLATGREEGGGKGEFKAIGEPSDLSLTVSPCFGLKYIKALSTIYGNRTRRNDGVRCARETDDDDDGDVAREIRSGDPCLRFHCVNTR